MVGPSPQLQASACDNICCNTEWSPQTITARLYMHGCMVTQMVDLLCHMHALSVKILGFLFDSSLTGLAEAIIIVYSLWCLVALIRVNYIAVVQFSWKPCT